MENKRDCQCITHEGPHWLHMDFLIYARNLRYLERVVVSAEVRSVKDFEMAVFVYSREEKARLDEKMLAMKSANRVAGAGEDQAYPYSLLGIDEQVQAVEERRKSLMDRLRRCFPELRDSVA